MTRFASVSLDRAVEDLAPHVKKLTKLQTEGQPIELVAVCDVYSKHRERAARHIKKQTGQEPKSYVDYRDMIEQANLDAVCIGTPDHWHHRQTVDALNAGLHVYCEKPMTKTVEEAINVMKTWQKSGKVMQVVSSIDEPSAVAAGQQNAVRRKARQSPDVPNRVLSKLRHGAMAILRT